MNANTGESGKAVACILPVAADCPALSKPGLKPLNRIGTESETPNCRQDAVNTSPLEIAVHSRLLPTARVS
jgi:hypothetical protein